MPEFFSDPVNMENIQQDYFIKKPMPKQMKLDGASAMLLSSAGPAKSTINSMMYGNLAVNILM
jgi:hypothetical protein